MPQSAKANQREKIRLNVRHTRNQLSNEYQSSASQQLCEKLSKINEINKATTIALYLANDGELNPTQFIQWCWQHQKKVVLPILHPFNKGHLLFLNYTISTPMKKNRYAILEPELNVTEVVPLKNIDVICTPLVAFDGDGQRLGMGGGFYDRTLAGLKNKDKSVSIIGLAHDCQEVQQVPTEPWDIPIPKIVTPTRIIEPGK